ncbi:MAG: histidine phosphatase family protein [Candidatus Altiarchaeales archaeon]|nr:histidine phosphatase family protein [Candidatus Altiarchaeales archaeon]
MSEPEYIFLVRHGESVGNVDWDIHATVPDWKIHLTDKGKEQAERAAQKLHEDITSRLPYYLRDETPPRIYCSPYARTRETAMPIRRVFPDHVYREDPRIREQDWGNYKDLKSARKIARERKSFGTFFYRLPSGESGADVYDRVSTFFDTLWRDFRAPGFPRTAIIVSHGLTIRLILMRWFHWTVEEYETLRNPYNCQIIRMHKPMSARHYILESTLRKRKV